MSLTHLDPEKGLPGMVDVGGKAVTARTATAECRVTLPAPLAACLAAEDLRVEKGPVFATAILAGTQAAKKTADLIPLCHVIPLDSVKIRIEPEADRTALRIRCTVKATHRTGVEMEALTGAAVAALTVYDMGKALSPEIEIGPLCLVEKTGGKADYQRNAG